MRFRIIGSTITKAEQPTGGISRDPTHHQTPKVNQLYQGSILPLLGGPWHRARRIPTLQDDVLHYAGRPVVIWSSWLATGSRRALMPRCSGSAYAVDGRRSTLYEFCA